MRFPFLFGLIGCGWNHLPDGAEVTLDGATWDPSTLIPREDGLIVHLPATGGVALVTEDGASSVELQGYARSLVSSKSTNDAGVFTESYGCNAPEGELDGEPQQVADCPAEYLEIHRGLRVLHGEHANQSYPWDAPFSQVAFAPNHQTAIAWLGPVESIPTDAVVNLAAAGVVDLNSGDIAQVDVGFGANDVMFSATGDRALVLSESRVTILDVSVFPPERTAVFHLTLDNDQPVVPSQIALTPDGRHALLTVADAADLYVLDLENPSVNLVSLSAVPSQMSVITEADRTLLVYADEAVVDVLEHSNFDLDTKILDEPATQIAPLGTTTALLSRPGSQDVVWFSPLDDDSHEFHVQGGLVNLLTSSTGDRAVAFTEVSGTPGMEVLNLQTFANPAPYLLPTAAQGAALTETDGNTHLLVLQGDALLSMNLTAGGTEEVHLPDAPLGIGSLENGGFYITHASTSGRISFLDPNTGSLTTQSGFAWSGLSNQPMLETAEAP